ncbi:AlbA family DNA-binding domain-containing protein [Nocardia abscessus]|uniref:AlbA family DNA-binding domain-containing protein n=1 Tax=Nocardia abscessus TaxID=120957 RepID=UPI0024571473|nr:ATP-binding protein [Nocardia abscessus]
MQSFPRLSKVLGARVDDITAAVIDRAIQTQVPEASDLDWKQAHYSGNDAGKREFAKDVTGLANGTGGILVIGVKGGSRACESTPVEISEAITLRYEQVCRDRIFPYLPGVEVREVEKEDGAGYYVIIVNRSADAPHAMRVGDDGHTFRYAVRIGTTTRYLHEAEIAARYRDRFVSQAQRAEALDRVHAAGLERLPSDFPRIALSLHPAIDGDLGIGSKAVAAVEGFVNTWMAYTSSPVETFRTHHRVVPGVRRAIINPDVGMTATVSQPHAQLHFNGAGFAALATPRREPAFTADAVARNADKIMQDYLELQILTLDSLLSQHADNTCSTGDSTLRAQLTLATQFNAHDEKTPSPAVVLASVRQADGTGFVHAYDETTLPVRRNPGPIEIAFDADELVTDIAAVIISAYAVACDVLAEFGIAEPCVLKPDGTLATGRIVDAGLRTEVEHWADQPGAQETSTRAL